MTYADPHACPACRARLDGHALCPRCGLILSGPIIAQLWQRLQQIDTMVFSSMGYRQFPPLTTLGYAGRYADPYACPACRGPIHGQPRCPQCGFFLSGPAAAALWQEMEQLDRLVAEARRSAPAAAAPTTPSPPQAAPPPPPQGAPPHTGPPPATPTPPAASAEPPPGSPQPPRRGIDVGAVILGLGAVLLLVAATIFISVSWDRLGLFGRSMVLFAVTVLATLVAIEVTRRRLVGSAEALWTVVLGLLALDWFAAHAQGLADLDLVPLQIHTAIWAAATGALGAAIAAGSRSRFHRYLVAPQVIGGIATWTGTWPIIFYLGGEVGWRPFWAGAMGIVVPLLVVLLAWRLKTQLAMWSSVPAAATVLPFLVAAAVYDTVAYSQPSELLLEGHAVPMLLLSAIAAVGAIVLPWGRSICVAVAIVGVFVVIVAGTSAGISFGVAMCVLAVVAVAAAWWLRGAGVMSRGVQLAVVVYAVLGVQALAIAWLDGLDRTDSSVGPWAAEARESLLEPLAVGALTIGVAGVCWAARRWLPTMVAGYWRLAVAAVLVGGTPATCAAAGVPFGISAIAALALAIVALVLLRRGGQVEAIAVGFLLPIAALTAVPSSGSASAAFLVVTVALAASAATAVRVSVTAVHAAVAVLSAIIASQAFVDARALDLRGESLALVVIALICFGLACWAVEALPVRLTLEGLASLTAAWGVLTGLADADANWLALLFLLIALALFAASLDVEDRRWAAIPALVSAVLSWLCLLIGQQVDAVEVVTVPLAVLALGLGGWFMHRDPALRTIWALSPGLLLAFLPSLPQSLDDPTSLRAWLLGGAAVIAVIVGWWRSWQAPFILGAAVFAVLVIVNLWPVAMAVQRWVLFGVLGVLLLIVGVTWESRVRQGRAVVRAIGAMR